MQRRDFVFGGALHASGVNGVNVDALNHLGKGFNFQCFYKTHRYKKFSRYLLEFVADFGFNLIRIPFDYTLLFKSFDPLVHSDSVFSDLDQMIEFSHSLGLNVVIAMHRAPGYCVNPPFEKRSLWKDYSAQKDFWAIWDFLSKRYREFDGIIFNLLNEPSHRVAREDYLKVIVPAIEVIRKNFPAAVICVDGLNYSSSEVVELIHVPNLIQSSRGYFPFQFTHWHADWIGDKSFPAKISWPLYLDGSTIDKEALRSRFSANWTESFAYDRPVLVGEFGVYKNVPHELTMMFLRDNLDLYRSFGWGWLLWELEGGFGVVNSYRADVKYQKVGEYLVDVEMLNLLCEYI